MAEIKKCVTDGFEMEYFKFGNGNRNMVIIPGLSVQSVMGASDPVIKEYEIMINDFSVYVFDRRKEVSSPYSIHDMAEDTVKVINKLGLADLYIFGASQGGMISMDIAINHPELVKKLVLGSTSSNVRPKQQGIINNWIKLAGERDRQALYLNFCEEVYPKEIFEQFRESFIEASKTITDKELDKFLILAEGAKNFDLKDRVKEIQCPTLVIGSYEDAILDSDATMEIAENLDFRPDFKLFMYKGYGHAAYDTAPDYRKRIFDFFTE